MNVRIITHESAIYNYEMGFTTEQKETEIHRDEARVSTKRLKGDNISFGNE
jgi:hypothetical protein